MPDFIDLAGEWSVALDEGNRGVRQRWWTRTFSQRIHLPGTTDQAGLGQRVDERCEDRLSRVWRWIGPAWYQRKVRIPRAWADKKVFLHLERTKDSQVWVDDDWVGSDDSLSTPHVYDLSARLTPGEHRLTLLVDNAKLPPVGPCHQVDERTQTNWNGIVGRLELRMRERVWIRQLEAYPDPAARVVELVAEVVNESPWSGKAGYTFRAEVVGREAEFDIPVVQTGGLLNHGTQQVRAKLTVPEGVPCWDEFDPTRLRITMESRVMPEAEWVRDRQSIVCGLRRFSALRGQFVINGRPTHLRGKNECALFPLTGYAPMDRAFWLRFLGVGVSYGINHYRFHSWCPPEAAFDAADELGIYFQVELPNKRGITEPENRHYTPPAQAYETLDELKGDAGDPAVRTAYLTREGQRILRAYGNHPSFVTLTLGNEIGGDEAVMTALCDRFRAMDPRHLYAMGTNHFHWEIRYRPADEFWVIKQTIEDRPIRGASWEARGHIDHQPPSTLTDYSPSLRGIPVPVIAHEIAQYEVYPDYRELPKYTGVLRARNLEIFRQRLKKAGMLDQASDFQKASGALSVVCRKEDIEAQLRTPGMGGFQLLDIQDFSGQGTALVGILDVFMDSKGLITPQRWREFCSSTVPLALFRKRTWTRDEDFLARIRIAHYGPHDLQHQRVEWSLSDGERTLAAGGQTVERLPTGEVSEIDPIHAPLNTLDQAKTLSLLIELPGTPHRNRYDLWVYPPRIDTTPPDRLVVARHWSPELHKRLASGAPVLLLPPPADIRHSVPMAFQTGFWSPMFRIPGRPCPIDGGQTPGTQGILLDPRHPLYSDFPTEFHGNWQWWHLLKNSRAMILDHTPRPLRPLLQVIDGIDRNHKLGLILEARVGKGRLILCSIDLPSIQQHPEARQLLACLQRYAAGPDCQPRHVLTPEAVLTILHGQG